MRVLAAEDRVDLDDLLLPLEGLEVVGHAEEVDLGRQLVGRVAPVAVGEDAELAALDERRQALLDVARSTRASSSASSRCSGRSREVFAGSAFRALTTSTQSSACRW